MTETHGKYRPEVPAGPAEDKAAAAGRLRSPAEEAWVEARLARAGLSGFALRRAPDDPDISRVLDRLEKIEALLAPACGPDGSDPFLPMESLPRDGTPVLVLLEGPLFGSRVHAAVFHGKTGMVGTSFAYDAPKPVGWMPQPKAILRGQEEAKNTNPNQTLNQ